MSENHSSEPQEEKPQDRFRRLLEEADLTEDELKIANENKNVVDIERTEQ